MTREPMAIQTFRGLFISKNGDIDWSPRSQDLTAPDFFFYSSRAV